MADYDLTKTHIKKLAEPKHEIALSTEDLNVYYGDKRAMHDASLQFERYRITALIGASGSGKST